MQVSKSVLVLYNLLKLFSICIHQSHSHSEPPVLCFPVTILFDGTWQGAMTGGVKQFLSRPACQAIALTTGWLAVLIFFLKVSFVVDCVSATDLLVCVC